MHMCVTTIIYTAIMVFAITGIGYAIGKPVSYTHLTLPTT